MKKAYTRIVQMIIDADTKEDLDLVRSVIDKEYREHCGSKLLGMYLQPYDVTQLYKLIDKVEGAV